MRDSGDKTRPQMLVVLTTLATGLGISLIVAVAQTMTLVQRNEVARERDREDHQELKSITNRRLNALEEKLHRLELKTKN